MSAIPNVTELSPGLDPARVRAQFPILHQQVHGRPLVYLDSAASAQKPQAVIDAITGCYTGYYANIHRGVYSLSERSTAAYEQARESARRFLNARSEREIVFVRGTTEAINLVASSFGGIRVGPGDEVLISHMEHHSNIVPWQLLCQRQGARLRVAPIDDRGDLRMEELEGMIGERTRLVSIVHLSNALGTLNPVRRIIELAHARGVPVLLDGAQAAPHLAVDVRALDCDFYTFSGHKTYGPTGIGVLYGREALLDAMPPYQGGGDMIRRVTFARTEYAPPPAKFEAGTPNIAGAIGLGAALEWLQALGLDAIAAHEQDLLAYATERVAEVPGIRLIGTARRKAGVLSFTLDGVHPHDVGTVLDREGVAVRAGHHCAQPTMERFGVAATSRASFGAYNTRDDADALVRALWTVKDLFER